MMNMVQLPASVLHLGTGLTNGHANGAVLNGHLHNGHVGNGFISTANNKVPFNMYFKIFIIYFVT